MGSRLNCDLSTFSDRLSPSHVAQSARLTSLELALEEEDAPGHQQIQDAESRNKCKQVRIDEAPKPCQKVQAITV